MQPFEKVERSKKQIMLNNFLGGIAWGLGVTIGLGILLALIGYVISQIDFAPVIEDTITNSIENSFKDVSPSK